MDPHLCREVPSAALVYTVHDKGGGEQYGEVAGGLGDIRVLGVESVGWQCGKCGECGHERYSGVAGSLGDIKLQCVEHVGVDMWSGKDDRGNQLGECGKCGKCGECGVWGQKKQTPRGESDIRHSALEQG